MLAWLGTKLAGALGGTIVGGIVDGYKAKLAATNTTDRLAVDLAVKDIEAERARRLAQRDLGIAAMSHPVWWIAWLLFVIPVGLYHATIFVLSTLGIPPCSPKIVTGCFTVLEVPADQKKLSEAVIQYLFLAQAGAGVAGAIIKRFVR